MTLLLRNFDKLTKAEKIKLWIKCVEELELWKNVNGHLAARLWHALITGKGPFIANYGCKCNCRKLFLHFQKVNFYVHLSSFKTRVGRFPFYQRYWSTKEKNIHRILNSTSDMIYTGLMLKLGDPFLTLTFLLPPPPPHCPPRISDWTLQARNRDAPRPSGSICHHWELKKTICHHWEFRKTSLAMIDW